MVIIPLFLLLPNQQHNLRKGAPTPPSGPGGTWAVETSSHTLTPVVTEVQGVLSLQSTNWVGITIPFSTWRYWNSKDKLTYSNYRAYKCQNWSLNLEDFLMKKQDGERDSKFPTENQRPEMWQKELGCSWRQRRFEGTGYDLCHQTPGGLPHGKEIIPYRLDPKSKASPMEGKIKGSRCQFNIKRRKLAFPGYLSTPGILHIHYYLILTQRKENPLVDIIFIFKIRNRRLLT